jgi:hypothetical protein
MASISSVTTVTLGHAGCLVPKRNITGRYGQAHTRAQRTPKNEN